MSLLKNIFFTIICIICLYSNVFQTFLNATVELELICFCFQSRGVALAGWIQLAKIANCESLAQTIKLVPKPVFIKALRTGDKKLGPRTAECRYHLAFSRLVKSICHHLHFACCRCRLIFK